MMMGVTSFFTKVENQMYCQATQELHLCKEYEVFFPVKVLFGKKTSYHSKMSKALEVSKRDSQNTKSSLMVSAWT
jgi:hypothetical protein